MFHTWYYLGNLFHLPQQIIPVTLKEEAWDVVIIKIIGEAFVMSHLFYKITSYEIWLNENQQN